MRPRPADTFAARVRGGEVLRGAILRMPCEMLVEVCGDVGLDFVVLDAEHGPGDGVALLHHLACADAAGIAALVRVGGTDEILRVLDLGACGVVAPHVDTPEDAAAVVAEAYYPPKGRRGFASYSRAGHYGLTTADDHLTRQTDRTIVIAMIESATAVANAPAIAAVDGIDALFLGPADYAVEQGGSGADQVAQALAMVRAAGRTMAICADADAAARHMAAGSQLVLFNVQDGISRLLGSFAHGASEARVLAPIRVPLIMLSGMLGDATLWDEVSPHLKDIALPIPLRIDRDDTIAEMAQTVLAQAPARFALAGHSLGGIVALEMYRRAPERVLGLALLNTSGRGPSETQADAWAQLRRRIASGEFGGVAAGLALETLPTSRREDQAVVRRSRAMAGTVGPDGLDRQLRAQATRPDSLPTLDAITVPTIVVSGDLDEVSRPELQEELARGIPDAVLVRIEGTGHMSPLESPGAVADALRDWLDRTRPERGGA